MTISKYRDERKKEKKKPRGRRKINGQFTPLTRVMQLSDAWQALSPRDVYIWTEIMRKYRGDEDEEFTFTYKDIPKGKMGVNQFYASRENLVKLGFFAVISKGGLKRKRTKFIISPEWKIISEKMKDKRLREEQSERDKKRWRESGLDSLLEEKDKNI